MDANPILDKVGKLSFDPVRIRAQALDKVEESGACKWQCDVFRRIGETGRERPDDAESFTLYGTPHDIAQMIWETAKQLGLNAAVEVSWGAEPPSSFSSRRPNSS